MGDAVSPTELRNVTSNIFTQPEVATVGWSQKQIEDGIAQGEIFKLPLASNPRAKMMGITDGFVKIFARTGSGTVIGGVVVAPKAQRPHPAHRPGDRAPAHGRSAGERVQRLPVAVGRDHRRGARDAHRGLATRSSSDERFPCRASISVRTELLVLSPRRRRAGRLRRLLGAHPRRGPRCRRRREGRTGRVAARLGRGLRRRVPGIRGRPHPGLVPRSRGHDGSPARRGGVQRLRGRTRAAP